MPKKNPKKNVPKNQQGNNKKKKSSVGEKIALILAGVILVPTIALTTCIILAQTTDMDFDWLADKAAAIEADADAEEAARIAEEEAAIAAKEQAAAEEAAAAAATSSSSDATSVNVELIENTAVAPTPTVEAEAEPAAAEAVDVENTVTDEGGTETSAIGNLGDMVWISSDSDYYHKDSSCSGIVAPTQVTMQDAIYEGKSPCSKCCQ